MYSFKVLDSSNRPFMNKATKRGRGVYIMDIAPGQTKTQFQDFLGSKEVPGCELHWEPLRTAPGHNHNGLCVLFFPHKEDADAAKSILREARFGGKKLRIGEIRFAANTAAGPAPAPAPALAAPAPKVSIPPAPKHQAAPAPAPKVSLPPAPKQQAPVAPTQAAKIPPPPDNKTPAPPATSPKTSSVRPAATKSNGRNKPLPDELNFEEDLADPQKHHRALTENVEGLAGKFDSRYCNKAALLPRQHGEEDKMAPQQFATIGPGNADLWDKTLVTVIDNDDIATKAIGTDIEPSGLEAKAVHLVPIEEIGRKTRSIWDITIPDKPQDSTMAYYGNTIQSMKDAGMIEPDWELGQFINPDDQAKGGTCVSNSQEFIPPGQMHDFRTLTFRGHHQQFPRPEGMTVGYGDWENWGEWQLHGREIRKDEVAKILPAPGQDGCGPIVFVDENGNREVIPAVERDSPLGKVLAESMKQKPKTLYEELFPEEARKEASSVRPKTEEYAGFEL
ncbi:hypothetical protein PG984_007281 [Apiospora sp. TS-2023a]